MFIQNLFLLICGHAIGDFSLQTEWTAFNKNRHVRDKFTEVQKKTMLVIWPWLLSAHALTHGLIVFVVLNRLDLAILESAVHWFVDFGKNEGWYNFHTDQLIHLLTKLLWASVVHFGIF
jgi:hypothetical protein